jgi:hypothetical protein
MAGGFLGSGARTPIDLICKPVLDEIAITGFIFLLFENGVCAAPPKPGVGIEVNEKEAHKHPYQQEVFMARFHHDGSVADG